MFRTRGFAVAVALTASLVLLSGCWNRGHRIQAPSALSFIDLDQILLQGISVNVPSSYVGDAVDEFTVSPALPAGLTLDPQTGRITGAPLDLTPTGTYVVTARNAGGETETILTITVHPQAPCGLAYAEEDVKYVGQISSVLNAPNFGCGPVDSWTIDPPLPAGLSLDPVTGVISGVPTGLIPRTEFLIIASNITGSDARTLFIEVETPAPCGLSYSDENIVYPPSVSIDPNMPSSACGAVDLYTVEPPLPRGLALDPITGEISGIPTLEQGETVHTVTATNAYGEDETELTLRISPVFEYTSEDMEVEYDPATGLNTFESTFFVREGANNATFPTPIIGLSMAVQHDPTILEPISVTPGPDLATLGGGTGPEFFEPLIQENAVTVGVIFSLDLTELLMADTAKDVLRVEYATDPLTLSGNTDGLTTEVRWGNPNALPPVANEVGLSGTYSVIPVLIDSTVTLMPAPATPTAQ